MTDAERKVLDAAIEWWSTENKTDEHKQAERAARARLFSAIGEWLNRTRMTICDARLDMLVCGEQPGHALPHRMKHAGGESLWSSAAEEVKAARCGRRHDLHPFVVCGLVAGHPGAHRNNGAADGNDHLKWHDM